MVKTTLLHWISNCPLGLVICILGIIGNIVSVFIWLRILKKRLDNGAATSMYFISLAIIDSFILVFFILIETIPAADQAVLHSYSYLCFYCYVGYPIFYFLVLCSIWLLISVTICRCVVVILPLKARLLCNPFSAFWGIILVIACLFAINSPRFMIYHPESINGTYMLRNTEFGYSSVALDYKLWVHCMLLVVVPWVSLSFLNASIIWSMKQRVRSARQLFSTAHQRVLDAKREQDKITWVLLTVTFTFLALLAGQCISHCLWMLKFDYGTPSWDNVVGAYTVVNLGLPINSAINWLLYCVSGSAFRNELFLWLRSLLLRRNSSVLPEQETRGSPETTAVLPPVNKV